MDEKTFHTYLKELVQEIERLPDEGYVKDRAAKSVGQDATAVARSLADTLDYLRLQVKYVVFDLEATRRENRYLRKMLETRPSHGGEEGPET